MAYHVEEAAHPKGAAGLMKRAHRKAHLFIWLILGPVMIATLLFAVLHRPAEPVNQELPEILLLEAR